jgi:hypothetical protein
MRDGLQILKNALQSSLLHYAPMNKLTLNDERVLIRAVINERCISNRDCYRLLPGLPDMCQPHGIYCYCDSNVNGLEWRQMQKDGGKGMTT